MLPLFVIVFVASFNLPNTAAMAFTAGNTPIQFPGSVLATAHEDDIPDSCKDLTYCTVKRPSYPEKKFHEMLKDYKPVPQPQLLVNLENRFKDDDDENNCKSELSYEPLYYVRQRRDQPWRTVIQAPGRDYIQRVRLEKCSKPDAPCFQSSCAAPGFTPQCKQTYSTWEVLVDRGDNQTELIKTDLPVCCSCRAASLTYM